MPVGQNELNLFDFYAKIYCFESFVEGCVILFKAKNKVYIIL